MPEATEEFKRRLREAFEEMHVGHTFTFRRTFTDGDVALFCGVTGDYNPYHQDESFAKEAGMGGSPSPASSPGACSRTSAASSFEYLAPVFVGDTITCTVTIAEKNEEKRRIVASAGFVNQDDVEVLRASFSGFPGRVRLAR